jgi:hypothetical protein
MDESKFEVSEYQNYRTNLKEKIKLFDDEN